LGQIRYFIEAVIEDLPVAPSFCDVLKVQEVIDTAKESNLSGRRIAL